MFTLAATNLAASMRRWRWRLTSAITASAAAEQRSAGWACWRGNAAGLGGWTFVTRISLATLQATGTRRAFTNDAMLARLDRELVAERDRVERQRAEDRKADADRLERIETDIRTMRDVMFDAFQHGRTD